MGRMAYITGWAMNQYWWRYRYTLDKEWLAVDRLPGDSRLCPVLHRFHEETGRRAVSRLSVESRRRRIHRRPEGLHRPAQAMQYLRSCLRRAILAAEALGVDEELRAVWRERLDHAAGDDGRPPLVLTGLEKECFEANVPEFGWIGRPYHPQPEKVESRPLPELSWYFGQYPIGVLAGLRGGDFVAERDLPAFRHMVEGWRRPNGLIWGMAVANYGRIGAWTESLGVAAPLQEMMLQSWDGALRIFPAWPKNLDARFETLRAEGAFLVSATWSKGKVTALSLRSEKGSPCKLDSPWSKGVRVTDSNGKEVPVTADRYARPEFATQPGMEYYVRSR